MATCGYVCPVCEGKTFLDNLEPCDYCQKPETVPEKIISDEDWLRSVHEGDCCSDRNE